MTVDLLTFLGPSTLSSVFSPRRSRLSPSVPNIYLCVCLSRQNHLCNTDDPNNEQIYSKVDKFHMEKDKISFDAGNSDSDDSVNVLSFNSRGALIQFAGKFGR